MPSRLPAGAQADSDDLEPSYGTNGRIAIAAGDENTEVDDALQQDGKVVVAGQARHNGDARFSASGAGIRMVDASPGKTDIAHAVARQATVATSSPAPATAPPADQADAAVAGAVRIAGRSGQTTVFAVSKRLNAGTRTLDIGLNAKGRKILREGQGPREAHDLCRIERRGSRQHDHGDVARRDGRASPRG